MNRTDIINDIIKWNEMHDLKCCTTCETKKENGKETIEYVINKYFK